MSAVLTKPCHASFMGEWCGTEDLEGFWATPQCVESPGRCLEVLVRVKGTKDIHVLPHAEATRFGAVSAQRLDHLISAM
eukprot:1026575-Amphidinium_carterae.1